MTTTDEQWADCPNCGARTTIEMDQSLELKGKLVFSCMKCGAPLAPQDATSDDPAPVVVMPAIADKVANVFASSEGLTVEALSAAILRDAADNSNGSLRSDQIASILFGVRSAVKLLTASGVINPKDLG